MKDLGIPDDEIKYTLGERPSYYAQLKFIAKRIYQRPEFFIDLYDTPANVERKKVALQAINSILERGMGVGLCPVVLAHHHKGEQGEMDAQLPLLSHERRWNALLLCVVVHLIQQK